MKLSWFSIKILKKKTRKNILTKCDAVATIEKLGDKIPPHKTKKSRYTTFFSFLIGFQTTFLSHRLLTLFYKNAVKLDNSNLNSPIIFFIWEPLAGE
jgi:hypothetical protein